MNLAIAVVGAGLAMSLLVAAWRLREAARADFIRGYGFPKGLIEKLQERHSGLAAKDAQLVALALRMFFLAHLKSRRRYVSMPSQIADDLWHEFILYTRHYEAFCGKAFGRFMHHTPAVVLGPERQHNIGLRRTWRQCCKEENINPSRPTRLPLLFALDAKLGVKNGFRYALDCHAVRPGVDGSVYCGTEFTSRDSSGCGGGCGGGSFAGDGDGGGSGCGGGCGGGD